MYRQSEKLLNSNISSTCPHNMANFGPLTAEIVSLVWGTPANFNAFRVLPSSLQRRRSPEPNQSLHDVWPSPGLVQYIIHFLGILPLREFFPVQNSLYVQVLRSPTLTALLHGTPAAGVSQTLRCGTRNGITQLSQRVPPIFGRAAITLGIGPHSCCFFKCTIKVKWSYVHSSMVMLHDFFHSYLFLSQWESCNISFHPTRFLQISWEFHHNPPGDMSRDMYDVDETSGKKVSK